MGGTVGEVLVEDGDSVEEEQVLAKLDDTSIISLQETVSQAEINLEQARINLRDAEENLEEAQHPSELDVAQAEASVANAKVALEAAQEALEEAENPYDESDITQAELAVINAEIARAISEAIEGVGGILNGGTDKELTLYWCKVAQPHFELALDVLADMLLHSKFDPQDIEKERQVIIEEINMSKDSPAQRVDMLIDGLLWPKHPLGRDIAGSKESVAAITRDMMLDYRQGQYLPNNTVVTIAGNIQHQQMITAVGQALGNWTHQRERSGYSAYKE
ncbi:unnamed protein product, partial [marine sediment metagenome]